jgi:hypothetical protein
MSRRRMMLATVGAAAKVSVFWRPTSTVVLEYTALLVPSGSAHHQTIDEDSPDDMDSYIAMGTGTANFTVGLSGPTLGTVTEIIIRARVKRMTSASASGRIRLFLNNVLYLDINGVFTSSFVTHEASIAPSEMTGWDMNPLDMKIIMSGFANSNRGVITWAEVEFK